MPLPRALFPIAVAAAGCAAPGPRPLPPRILHPLPVPAEAGAPGAGAVREPADRLTLADALALALVRSPLLSAATHEIRAAEAGRLQAGLLPNPEVGVAVENVGGSLRDQAETTVVLSQLFELGGKRAARLALADAASDLAGWDFESRRLDVLAATASDFAGVLGAQDRVGIAEETVRIAGEALRATADRAAAGAVGRPEVRRAEIEAASAGIDLDRALRDLEAARARLAAHWGAARAAFARAEGTLAAGGDPPPLAGLVPLLGRNPDLARFEAEVRSRSAEVDAARAGRVPDVTLGAGRRYLDGTGDDTWVFEASVPLPLFDRGQGAVGAAEARLSAARLRRAAEEARLGAELVAARGGLETAAREVRVLADSILPAAREVLDATTERYRSGKVGYLEVLDARRTLAEASTREVEAREELLRARIGLERLVAGPLEGGRAEGRME